MFSWVCLLQFKSILETGVLLIFRFAIILLVQRAQIVSHINLPCRPNRHLTGSIRVAFCISSSIGRVQSLKKIHYTVLMEICVSVMTHQCEATRVNKLKWIFEKRVRRVKAKLGDGGGGFHRVFWVLGGMVRVVGETEAAFVWPRPRPHSHTYTQTHTHTSMIAQSWDCGMKRVHIVWLAPASRDCLKHLSCGCVLTYDLSCVCFGESVLGLL